MRFGYYGGGPGVLASGLVWLTAGLIALLVSLPASIAALFIGGVFIYPLGMAFSKLLKRPGSHSSGNPLSTLALETTALLFIGLFIAFSVAQIQSAWFYPVMLMVIGGRYLMFQTLYGMRLYWLLGGLLTVAGAATLLLGAPAYVGAFLGGSIELVFALIILNAEKRATTQTA